jgi:hypothetical protein
MAKKKLGKYEGYFSWAVVNGLIFGILFTYGQDISETGMLSTILKIMNETLPIPNYFLLQALIFIIGAISLIYETYTIWKEGIVIKIMAISAFLGMFLLFLGTGFNITFIQNLGVVSFIVSILVEGYLLASER